MTDANDECRARGNELLRYEDYGAMSEELHFSRGEASNDPRWHHLCEQIGQFCLRAGSPSVTNEPHEDIEKLRLHATSTSSHTREGDLQAEVTRLRDLCRTQQRIITNLTFRHTLEALPGPRLADSKGNPINSSTAHWRRFWNDAWNNAQSQASSDSSSSTKHPLSPLFDRFDRQTQRQIKILGEGLYGTLSTNIHHFSGGFEVNEDQWDVLQAAILRAITPITTRKDDGSIDWDLERQRY